MSSIDNLTDVTDIPSTPDQCSPDEKQRLRIHVPNVPTTLSMGAESLRDGIRDNDGGTVSYDGFGVHTMGHVYLAAEDGVAAVKAKKEVTIHSTTKTLDIRSKENAYFGSDASTYIRGRTGTLIVGGEAPDFFSEAAPRLAHDSIFADNADPDPWKLEALTETQALQDSMVSNFTQIQGVIMGISKSLGATATKIGSVSLIFGLKKAIGSLLGSTPGAGVGIHGTEGVNITSPKAVTIHAQKHILLSSTMESELQSLVSTNIGAGVATFVGAAGATTVLGGVAAKLVSGKFMEVASRFGEVKIRGPEIKVGYVTKETPQMPTKTVLIASKNNSTLGSEEFASVVGGKGALVGAGDAIDLLSKNALNGASKDISFGASGGFSVSAGKKFGVICGKSQLSADKNRIVMSVGDEAPAVPPTEDQFYKSQSWTGYNEFQNAWRAEQKKHVNYHSKLKHAQGSWTQVKVTPKRIQLKVKGGSELQGDSSGWKIAGTKLVVKK